MYTHIHSYYFIFPPFYKKTAVYTGCAAVAFPTSCCLAIAPYRCTESILILFLTAAQDPSVWMDQLFCHIFPGLGTEKSFLPSVVQQTTKEGSGGSCGEQHTPT